MKLKIPDRWIDYRPFHKVIEGTRFLPFKVPLKEQFNHHLDHPNLFFTPRDFVERCSNENIRLGMVIDLTFTTRYYDRQEFENIGIKYKKIFTQGHEIPKLSVLMDFKETVNHFLQTAPNDIVAVHCTHGVNRTGYVLCHYMIHELGMTPQQAMNAFSDGRGYPIERQPYIASLREQRNQAANDRSGGASMNWRYRANNPTTRLDESYGRMNQCWRSNRNVRPRIDERVNSPYSSFDSYNNHDYQVAPSYNNYCDTPPSNSVYLNDHHIGPYRRWHNRRNNDAFYHRRNSRYNHGNVPDSKN